MKLQKINPFKISTLLALGAAMVLSGTAWAGVVSVSNYPLYLLSKEVTQGVNDAHVLLGAGDVGHHGSLSPSALKQVHDSQFVVWFGGQLEENLVNSVGSAPNAISLFDFDAFHRLPMRDMDGKPIADSFDVHIWLKPNNAKAIVAALAVIHGHANPEHKQTYAANAQAFYQKMDAAAVRYQQKNTVPYWAYHDAYQYLEADLNLTMAAALTPDHHLSPKASRFRTLQQNRPQPVMCLASQIPVSEGIKSRLAPLNVLIRQEDMSDGEDFVSAWTDLADNLVKCSTMPNQA